MFRKWKQYSWYEVKRNVFKYGNILISNLYNLLVSSKCIQYPYGKYIIYLFRTKLSTYISHPIQTDSKLCNNKPFHHWILSSRDPSRDPFIKIHPSRSIHQDPSRDPTIEIHREIHPSRSIAIHRDSSKSIEIHAQYLNSHLKFAT